MLIAHYVANIIKMFHIPYKKRKNLTKNHIFIAFFSIFPSKKTAFSMKNFGHKVMHASLHYSHNRHALKDSLDIFLNISGTYIIYGL